MYKIIPLLLFLKIALQYALSLPVHARAAATESPEDNHGLRMNLIEGDIRIKDYVGQPEQLLSVITSNAGKLWPNKTIPYELDLAAQYSSDEQAMIKQAVSLINSISCLTWRPAVTSDAARVRFIRGGGCWSYIGFYLSAVTYQEVSLDTGCFILGTVAHEMLHAMGFWHEQSRYDRDYYVVVNWSNVQYGAEYQFRKTTLYEMQNTAPYDYNSVMHYPPSAFSRNFYPTLSATFSAATFGQRTNMSALDVWKLNQLYSCQGLANQPSPPYPLPDASTWNTSLPISCDFESGLCIFYQDLTDQLDWNRYTYTVPSSNTGPSGDHTSGSGVYIYLPTEQSWASGFKRLDRKALALTTLTTPSTPKAAGICVGKVLQLKFNQIFSSKGAPVQAQTKPNDITGNIANLYTSKFTSTQGCVQFWYNMYGSTIGRLNVYMVPLSGSSSLILTISGNRTSQTEWLKGQATYLNPQPSIIRILFQGVAGSSYTGDIALDDIAIWEGTCESGGTTVATSSTPDTTLGITLGVIGGSILGVVLIVLAILFGLKII